MNENLTVESSVRDLDIPSIALMTTLGVFGKVSFWYTQVFFVHNLMIAPYFFLFRYFFQLLEKDTKWNSELRLRYLGW
jgi:hypothetical protein